MKHGTFKNLITRIVLLLEYYTCLIALFPYVVVLSGLGYLKRRQEAYGAWYWRRV